MPAKFARSPDLTWDQANLPLPCARPSILEAPNLPLHVVPVHDYHFGRKSDATSSQDRRPEIHSR
jgi:hypothetical protein